MKKKIIIFLLVFFLTTGVGYALLSDTINITGTATATGILDVNIIDAVVSNHIGSEGSSIIISQDKNKVEISVPELQYPGSYTEFTITIKNEGNINAKLIDIIENSMGDSNIEVSYNNIAENSLLGINQTLSFTVKVGWKDTSTEASVDGASININFVYEQNV